MLAAVISTMLVPIAQTLLDEATENGEPVQVVDVATYRSPQDGSSVVFPAGTTFTTEDLEDLNSIRSQRGDTTAWLEQLGGVPPGTVSIRLTLQGNRSNLVRIVNIQPISKCEAPFSGLYFADPPAGADDSSVVEFNLDDETPTASYLDEGRVQSYFPERTISLDTDEQHVLKVTASTRLFACNFNLKLTIVEDSKQIQQIVKNRDGDDFSVSAEVDMSEYESVYLGGVICSRFSKAPKLAEGEGLRSSMCSK